MSQFIPKPVPDIYIRRVRRNGEVETLAEMSPEKRAEMIRLYGPVSDVPVTEKWGPRRRNELRRIYQFGGHTSQRVRKHSRIKKSTQKP